MSAKVATAVAKDSFDLLISILLAFSAWSLICLLDCLVGRNASGTAHPNDKRPFLGYPSH
jgi:hypothetical protein